MNRTPKQKQNGRWLVGALAGASLALGCGGPQSFEGGAPLEQRSADNDGIAEMTQPLDAVGANDCIFYSVAAAPAIKGQIDLTIGSGKTYILSKHALNGNVLVNNLEIVCKYGGTSGTAAAVKAADIKAVNVLGAGGTETLILDFANGSFGAAAAATTGSGIAIDNAVENLKVRTSSAADKVAFGRDSGGIRYVDFDGKAPGDIKFSGNGPASTVNLGGGADTFDATGSVTLFGTGAQAFDRPLDVYGAAGNDIITLGSNSTTPITAATDNIYGGEGDDTISAGDGADKVWGGKGNDTLKGDVGADYVVGEEGSDKIDEGTASNGADRLYGWLNNDQNGDGSDDITDGLPSPVSTSGTAFGSEPSTDIDTISYANRTVAVIVSPGVSDVAGTWTKVTGVGASETAADCNDGAAGETDCVRGDFEVIEGGSANDTIYSGPADETIKGNAGDDTLFAMRLDTAAPSFADGADIFMGGAGTDTVSYRMRSAAVCVTIANSTSVAADKDDGTGTCSVTDAVVSGVLTATVTLTSTEKDDVQSDIEIVEGGAGADVLVGNDSNNTLRGAAGNDSIVGKGGDDVFDEDYGTDVDFTTANTANGSDTFWGGTGTDDRVSYNTRTVDLCVTIQSTGAATTATVTASGEGTTVTTGGGAIPTCTATEGDKVKMDIESAIGGSGDDYLVGNESNNKLDGSTGTDYAWCGAGEEDFAFSAGDVGFDQDETTTDQKTCEL